MKKFLPTYTEFLNENEGYGHSQEVEPYYNEDFKNRLEDLLTSLGYKDITFTTYGVDFHNPKHLGDGPLVTTDKIEIYDFIELYGYNADQFRIRTSVIMFPTEGF